MISDFLAFTAGSAFPRFCATTSLALVSGSENAFFMAEDRFIFSSGQHAMASESFGNRRACHADIAFLVIRS